MKPIPRCSIHGPAADLLRVFLCIGMAMGAPCFAQSEKTSQTGDLRDPTALYMVALEGHLLQLANQHRREHEVDELEAEADLARIARLHSRDMLERNFLDHVNPDGLDAERRVALGHRKLIGTVGENVWSGFGFDLDQTSDLATGITEDLLSSPSHRENLLHSEFTHLGVGVAAGKGRLCVTQLFAQAVAFLQKPVPPRVPAGERLDLRIRIHQVKGRAGIRYDYWDASRQKIVAGPLELKKDRVLVSPGRYLLRFYFPSADSGHISLFEIFNGPEIEVLRRR